MKGLFMRQRPGAVSPDGAYVASRAAIGKKARIDTGGEDRFGWKLADVWCLDCHANRHQVELKQIAEGVISVSISSITIQERHGCLLYGASGKAVEQPRHFKCRCPASDFDYLNERDLVE